MNSDLVKGAIAFVIVGVIGYVLLVGAAQGWLALPTGFGLFNQDDWIVRIITLVVLLVIAFLLYRVFMQSRSKM
jgi:uncharacterized RDD family membrane protein YckC